MFLVFTVLNEVAKVMFLHVSVILSTGGVCPIAYWDTPPWTRGRHPSPKSKYPRDQRQAPPPEQTPPRTVHDGRYGQQAGGTHPTGM